MSARCSGEEACNVIHFLLDQVSLICPVRGGVDGVPMGSIEDIASMLVHRDTLTTESQFLSNRWTF